MIGMILNMSSNLSFFYTVSNKAISGEIRGRQIASYLGGNMNPENSYNDDTCIYVKCFPPDDFPERSFVDIVDSKSLVNWVNERPQIGAIAISKIAQAYLFHKLKRKDIHFIPEHHCNFERVKRTDRDVITVGYIGCRTGSEFPEDIKEQFAEVGLDFKYNKKYKTRLDVIDFYKSIDIQIMNKYIRHKAIINLKNPLKLANAGSFGIPTVAYPENNFIKEFGGCFIEARTISEMVQHCKDLKEDKTLYQDISGKVFLRAQDYHIDKIAPLYNEL